MAEASRGAAVVRDRELEPQPRALTKMEDYKGLPLYYHDRVHAFALVDAADFPRLSQHHWLIHKCGRPFRFAEKKRKVYLTQEIMQPPRGIKFINANGNPLDCRRENLRMINVGRINFDRQRVRNPYRLQFFIENVRYQLGGWPSKEAAEDARQAAAEVAIKLRGSSLGPSHVRHALLVAVGKQSTLIAHTRFTGKPCVRRSRPHQKLRAAELMEFASTILPMNIPAEIREEAQQAIIFDLLTRKVSPHALKDSQLVRRYVRAAYGFQDGYKFRSLDAPVNDGETSFGELIAA